jgi:hypothetical protein
MSSYSKIKPRSTRGKKLGGGPAYTRKRKEVSREEKKQEDPFTPYHSSLYPEVKMEGASLEIDNNKCIATFGGPEKMDLIAFSQKGVNISAGGKPYVRLEQKIANGQQIFKVKSLGEYLKNMDYYAWDAYKVVEPSLKEAWGSQIGANDTKITLTGGWSEWERNAKNHTIIEVPMYPNLKWTDTFEHDTRKKKILPYEIAQLFGNSAISNFLIHVWVQKVCISVDPNDQTSIKVTPWLSVKLLTWVNSGQDCRGALERMKQEEKEKREENRIQKVQELVDLFEKDSTSAPEARGSFSSSSSRVYIPPSNVNSEV